MLTVESHRLFSAFGSNNAMVTAKTSVADPDPLDPDPDPSVRGMDPDPDPSIIKQK